MLKKKDMNLCRIGLVVYRLEEYLLFYKCSNERKPNHYTQFTWY